MRQNHNQLFRLQNLTLQFQDDPIEQAISAQLANPCFNEYPCIESLLINAVDRKYGQIPRHVKVIQTMRLCGLTYRDISGITGYCEKQIRRLVKQI